MNNIIDELQALPVLRQGFTSRLPDALTQLFAIARKRSGDAGLAVFIPKGIVSTVLCPDSGNIKVFLSYLGFTPFVVQLAKVKKGGPAPATSEQGNPCGVRSKKNYSHRSGGCNFFWRNLAHSTPFFNRQSENEAKGTA